MIATLMMAAAVGLADPKYPEGSWVVVRSEQDGEVVAEGDEAARTILIVNGLKFRSETDGKTVGRMTFKFKTSSDPAEFDATVVDGRGRSRVRKGIYKIEGDTWTYCYGPPGGDRPKEFSSRSIRGAFLVVAKRKEPARKAS